MPAKNRHGNLINKLSLAVQGKQAGTGEINSDWDFKGAKLPVPHLSSFRPLPTPRKLSQRAYSTLSPTTTNDAKMGPCEMVFLNTTSEGKIQATRHQKEKERNPDRICLDKRGITSFPNFVGEGKIKLLSLQHNLISKIEEIVGLTRLVFLDLYNNQIASIEGLDNLIHLRVLLLGKNRVQLIKGLGNLKRLEVLDLHGNQIYSVSGLSSLHVLKVLNLASNQIRTIEPSHLQGLHSLKELNLRRNRIKEIYGFDEIPELQKLYISNNEIQNIEDIHDVANALNLKEITVDGNPVALTGDCAFFLVAFLSNLKLLNQMTVLEEIKKSALEWRKANLSLCEGFSNLKIIDTTDVKKNEVISRARIHWKFLRSQAKTLVEKENKIIKNVDILEASLVNKNFDSIDKKFPERPSSVPNSLKNGCSVIEQCNEVQCKSNSLNAGKSGTRSQVRQSGARKAWSAAYRKRQKYSQGSLSQSSENQLQLEPSSYQAPLGPLRLPPILVPFLNNSGNEGVEKTGIIPIASLKNSLQLKNSSDSSSGNLFCPSTAVTNQNNRDGALSEELNPNADSSISSMHSDSSSDESSREDEDNRGVTSISCMEEDDSDLRTVNSSEDGKIIAGSSLGNHRMKKTSYRSQIRLMTCKNKQRVAVLPSRTKEQGGDYLIEIEDNCLNIYGQGALRHIDKPWNPSKAGEVSFVKFHYISFNSVALLFGRIKQLFPNVEHFNFKETNIYCLGQINALAEVQGLTSLEIDEEGNPITSKNWRSYAVFRLYHWGLRFINGKEIKEEEVSDASGEFRGLSDIVLWSLPDALLLPLLGKLHIQGDRSANTALWSISPKEWLWKVADPALRDVVAKEALQWRRANITQEDAIWRQKGYSHLSHMIDIAFESVEKLKHLEKEWPSILSELIRNTLVDYSQLDSYMKKSMLDLKIY